MKREDYDLKSILLQASAVTNALRSALEEDSDERYRVAFCIEDLIEAALEKTSAPKKA
ncbi:hypothetical protein [Vibrio quintilis]|uniref:Uncharacterized protein n=1 Tax=Vibrio quintilis TaxID=1117707 RepID=A0A1M7YTY9_9VIBR|nr:hypothetical protein [Vibrio quintilis]SHO56075.1 hypothetical protein VQ7734_01838 [Vibrio quintilis]